MYQIADKTFIFQMPRAIDGRRLHRHGLYVGHSETVKIKIRKTNLECPLESIKPKNGMGKGDATVASILGGSLVATG